MQTIQGTFIQALPVVEGESARGHWTKGGFVIEYGDEYPRKVAFQFFGSKKAQLVASIPPGCPVHVAFFPESREFNGRYYTELNCSSVNIVSNQPTAPQQPMQNPYAMPQGFQQQTVGFPAPQQQFPQYQQPAPMPSGLYPQQQAPQPAPTPAHTAAAAPQQPAVQLPDKDPDLPF